ncbi:Peptidyl-prolyl cis-trans isomerase-like 4 [Schistosoma japonicum]|nr:Peptidyl-prolyl cis-trans isomerase-like 4 [Schistosoma japonicum]
MAVLVETSLGAFVLDLYCEEKPRTCLNFIKLCKMKHFNFCLFHSVQKNLVAQSGDPSGTGRGGWSFYRHLYGEQARYFDAEKKPKISHSRKGLISMVDNGSGQHGSQFFITLADDLNYLDLDTRLEEDEELDDTDGLPSTQIEKLRAEQEVRTHTQLLTLIGDLPDADVKPPNNVLFVCKLNPVTTSEDLEIIFSRFGDIKSCEVVRDKRTGASLQYAFIEFEKEAYCEDAYFKMDKVVIDDRRIHVDFSQSVAREWQCYRKDKIVHVQYENPPKSKESSNMNQSYLPRSYKQSQPSHSYSHQDKKKKYSPVRHCSPPVLGEEYDVVISEESYSSSSSPINSKKKAKGAHPESSKSSRNHHRKHKGKHKYEGH